MKGDSVKLSKHARERCEQMGIRTGAVKRVVRKPSTSWRTRRGKDRYLVVVSSKDYPSIAVVYSDNQTPPLVVTVLWKTQDRYDRSTFEATAPTINT